jgi:hypothetical protein
MTDNSDFFEKECLPDGIIIYRIQVSTGECADRLFDELASEFAHAKAEKRSTYFVYDLRKMSKATPYMLQRMGQLSLLPDLPEKWYIASVTGNAFVTGIVHLVKTISLTDSRSFEQSQIFDHEPEALEWLRSQKSISE